MAFLRASLAERGFVRADLRARKFRAMVQVAGVVLIRQRPGIGQGRVLHHARGRDGVANLVVWPDLMEKHRKVVMGARLMEVRGRVEYDDEVIHVIAAHLHDATGATGLKLSDDLLSRAAGARRSRATTPLPGRIGRRHRSAEPFEPPPGVASAAGHPRDVRRDPAFAAISIQRTNPESAAMIDPALLATFAVVTGLTSLTPGPSMLFIMSQAVWRAQRFRGTGGHAAWLLRVVGAGRRRAGDDRP
jgi:hypothetical protein